MRSNAAASSPTSSPPLSCTGSSKLAARDPVGRALEPPDPPGEQPGAAVAEQQRDQERGAGREEHAAPHEVNAAQLALERIAEK